jgi:hypothetical protein
MRDFHGTCRRRTGEITVKASCPLIVACLLALVGHNGARAESYDHYSVPSGDTSGNLASDLGQSVIAQDGLGQGVPWEATTDGAIDVSHGECGPCQHCRRPEHAGVLVGLHEWCHGGHGRACRECGRPVNCKPEGLFNRVFGEACPRLIVQADTLLLWQGNIGSRVLYTDVAGAPLLNVNQINGPVAVGPRIGMILNIDQCYGIEANWFSVQNLDGVGTVPNTGGPFVMNDIVGALYQDIDDATVNTTGAIQSFELNWREWNGGVVTWLVGFRWVEWNQGLTITDNFVDSLSTPGVDAFDVQTRNDLYGAQVGADVLLWDAHQVLRFNGIGKAGVFGNWAAEQRTLAYGDRPPAPLDVAAQSDEVAFFGEVGINGSLKLSKWLWWRAGYNFFWLSGVAVPSRQLSLTDAGASPPTTSVNSTGSIYLHGVNTGIEARW